MGGLTQALAKAAADLGVEIRTDAEVRRILVEDGAATGVVLANGDELRARNVASNVDCRLTFETFLDPQHAAARVRRRDPAHRLQQRVGEDQRRARRRCRTSPRARARRPGRSTAARSTCVPIRTTSSAATTTRSTAGRRRDPIVECTIPSSVDPTRRAARAPPDVDVLPVRTVRARRRARGTRRRTTPSPTAASPSSSATRRASPRR